MTKSNEIRRRRNLPSSRLPSIRSGVTIVWLDDPSLPIINNSELLSHNDHMILYYTKVGKAIKYIKKTTANEYLIVVLNKLDLKPPQTVLARLQQCQYVREILIVASDDENMSFLTSKTSTLNSISLHGDVDSMLIHLHEYTQNTAARFDNNELLKICSSEEKSLRDIRRELGGYLWNFCYCLILSEMFYNSLDAKQQFLMECRAFYRGNAAQLAKISDFENTYQSCDAIFWYTKDSFVYRIVNRALRSKDAYALYICRYFVVDLCKSLATLSAAQKPAIRQVYRGTTMARDEVERLSVNSLVTANDFLSSSLDAKVAKTFAGIDQDISLTSTRNQDDPYQPVLYKISVDFGSKDVTVATVSTLSDMPDEDEVIFGLNSSFIITSIEYNNLHRLWVIEMTTSSEVNELKREYEALTQNELRDVSPIILYATNLIFIDNNLSQALCYCRNLLKILPIEHADRPSIYFCLGSIYRFMGRSDQARAHLEDAESMHRQSLPQSVYAYGCTLAGLGILYSELGESTRALEYYERAIDAHAQYFPPDHPEMLYHVNRLAFGYWQEKQYERGLALIVGAESACKNKLPTTHHTEAQTLHLKGLLHHALGNYEPALEYYHKALQMREILLGNAHVYVARTCYRLGLLYEELGQYSAALDHAKRALNTQEGKYPADHWEVILSRDLLDRLRENTGVLLSSLE